jgi:hypothetical protein
MATIDYLKISTLVELRTARKSLSGAITASEKRLSDRAASALRFFQLRKILLPLVKKLRASISGIPFAKT